MSYQISFNQEDNIVYVTASGTVNKDDYYAGWKTAVQLCEEHTCTKLLADLRDVSSSSLSTMESYTFAETIGKTPTHICIAHVLPKHPKAWENVLLASTVEANLGKATREFKTIEEARDWLLNLT